MAQICPAARLRSLSSGYNCAGLVLAFRRTWIDDLASLPRYLSEDGYQRLKPNETPFPGDVVVYKLESGEIAHVGFVLEVPLLLAEGPLNPLVLSKWGKHGEYVHQLMDIPPVLGQNAEFWSDRVMA